MPTVRYEAPRSVADAVRLMQADSEARVLAGGTDLLIQFRAGWRQPSAFIDVKHIPELIAISERDDGVRIGASAAAASICEHPALNRFWPGLVEATHLIGSTQIQGRASLGGNLCNASPAADSTCALIVNRARCVIAGPSGERSVPVEAFCTAPGRTVLERGEILVAIDLPRPAARNRRCVPPVDSPHGDGHRGCRRRRQRHARCSRQSARPRASRSAPSPRPRCSYRPRWPRWSVRDSTTMPWAARPTRREPPRSRSTTNGAPSRIGVKSLVC